MSTRQSTVRAPRHNKKKTDATLKVVRRNKRGLLKRGSQRRVTPFLVLGGMTVIAIVFAILLSQVVLAQSGFRMAKLRERTLKAEARHAELELQAAKLDNAERIERYAIDHLGMVQPTRVEYIVADVGSRDSAQLAQGRAPENVDVAGQAAPATGDSP